MGYISFCMCQCISQVNKKNGWVIPEHPRLVDILGYANHCLHIKGHPDKQRPCLWCCISKRFFNGEKQYNLLGWDILAKP